MAPHEQRVIDEKYGLDEKRAKLLRFTLGDVFASLPVEECRLLFEQLGWMNHYSNTLGKRIARFTTAQQEG